MKTKNILYLIILLVAAFAIAIYLLHGGRQASMQDRHRGFRIDKAQQIVRIELTSGENQPLKLELDADGIWRFNQIYKANASVIRELLGSMRQLNVLRPVALAAQDSINLLLDKVGVQVEVFARLYPIVLPGGLRLFPFNWSVRRFVVGPETKEGDGTYMRMQDSQTPFVVHIPGVKSNLSGLFSSEESIWRDPVVIDLNSEQIARIEVTYNRLPEESFVIDNRENNPRLLQNQLAIDPAHFNRDRIGRFLKSFTELYYDKLLIPPADSVLQHELIKPEFFEITIADHEGNSSTLVFYRRLADRKTQQVIAPGAIADPNVFFMQVNGGHFAIGNYFVFNRIMRPLSFFMPGEDSR